MNSRFVGTFIVLASIVLAATQSQTPLTDQEIASQVEHRLIEREIRGVTVVVHARTVTLSGTVRSLWAKEEAVEQAGKVSDVRAVVSEVTVVRAENDQAVADAVAGKLRRYVFYTIFDDVEIEMTNGVATLTGYVTMPYKAQAMSKLVSRVDGIQQVVDHLEPLPVSGFDDQIRYAAAVRIYDDPLFWNYAIQVDPPIHIVVKHGRVTLTGIVMSDVERRKAEQIAREIFGVLSVDNQLEVEQACPPETDEDIDSFPLALSSGPALQRGNVVDGALECRRMWPFVAGSIAPASHRVREYAPEAP